MNHNFRMTRLRILFLAIIIGITGVLPYTVSAASVQDETNKRTKEEIVAQWQKYYPLQWEETYEGNQSVFEVVPSATAPYTLGKVKSKHLEDGLNAVNFARYLAGLPHDVVLDKSLEKQQQAGALVNAINKNLSHTPKRPDKMSDEMYRLATQASSTSNLSMGRLELYNTIFKGYMSDNSSQSNLDTVGHRRWIINPLLKKTMFGMASSVESSGGSSRPYSSMYAFNQERSASEVEYQYIAWPSAGYFPLEVFSPQDPWSVSLNTAIYDAKKTANVAVKVTRERDKKVWNLNKNSRNYSGDLFNVDTEGYGIAYAIIFRPGYIDSYRNDDVYQIEISGLTKVDGKAATIKYSTQFFQMLTTFDSNEVLNLNIGDKLKLEGAPGAYISSNSKVASIDADGYLVGLATGQATIISPEFLYQPSTSLKVNVARVDKAAVQVSSWAKEGYNLALEAGLVYGNPPMQMDTAITRAKFVQQAVNMIAVLQNKEFSDLKPKNDSPFKDIPNSETSIIWAYENKIIDGTGNGKFSPDDLITREQAAKLLLNVYEYLGGEIPMQVTSKFFKDEGQIANWAKGFVDQSVALNLMNGVSADRFDPKGRYTHEQTIVTLVRIFTMFK